MVAMRRDLPHKILLANSGICPKMPRFFNAQNKAGVLKTRGEVSILTSAGNSFARDELAFKKEAPS